MRKTMASGIASSNCPHVSAVGDYTQEDITKKQEIGKCEACGFASPNLWVCLHADCLFLGCGERGGNHSFKHYLEQSDHALALNVHTLRVWCYDCREEVFLENNDPRPTPPGATPINRVVYVADPDTEEEEDADLDTLKPRGLTGLQNIGNTCYMNAALQALSNCPELTNFFRDCGAYVRSNKKPGLAKNYMRLIKDMWHKRRPSYVAPTGIAYGIRMLFPVFRGYTHQDAQEFLRCFMDQLHEELKETRLEMDPHYYPIPGSDLGDDFVIHSGEIMGLSSSSPPTAAEESSQSEAEFETCDSGLSSEKGSHCGSRGTPEPEDDSMGQEEGRDVHHRAGGDWGEPSEAGDNRGVAGFPPSGTFWNPRDHPSGDGHHSLLPSSTHPTSAVPLSKHTNSPPSFPTPTTYFPPLVAPKKKVTTTQHSIISDIFDGKILSSVQCLTCDTVSTTRETFQDLSLPIPSRDHLHMLHSSSAAHHVQKCADAHNNQSWLTSLVNWLLSWFWGPQVSLQDCLAAFFSADELKGENMYSCEKCKKLRNGMKYSKVLQLPQVLCIHLKRFRHEVMFSSKISNYVSFPLEGLDMAPFLHKDCHRGVTLYNLVAVICHHGTAGSGHYVTYALNYLNEQWYEYDDQYVTAVDPQVVQNCEAYVLFYRKTSDEIIKKRQRCVDLIALSKQEFGFLNFYISKQWINRFNYFAEPGPITNYDFLCIHGGVHPNKASYVEELCTAVSQSVWEYLQHTFGGGPSCSHLYLCPICQTETDNMKRRKKQEYDKFVALNDEFQSQATPTVVYAISMDWFKQWENFIKNKEAEPPGPIDNSSICHMKGSQPMLKIGSVFGSLSEEMWRFLHGIYGGGPEIVQHNQPAAPAHKPHQTQASPPSGWRSPESCGPDHKDDMEVEHSP